MAITDYGVLIYKNGIKLPRNVCDNEDSYDSEILINNKKFSVYPKGTNIKYGDILLQNYPEYKKYRKLKLNVYGVYFEIKNLNNAI